MSDFYDRYEDRLRTSNMLIPAGYSARGFSGGPGGTVLVAACDLKSRTCAQIQQFTADLKGRLGQWDMPESVLKIRYFEDQQLMAVFNNQGEIHFYAVD